MATDPRLGSTVGGYRIESLLGRGGMSVVYIAEDVHLGRKVALKFLAPELVQDSKFQERFVRESRLAASLEHPNIVTVYEARESDGQLYLAMRYVAGMDLRRLIVAEGPFDSERTVSIISQAASALDAAHAEGLIHRDVKPGNILVTPRSGSMPTDRVYLSDFGLTKRATSDTGLTASGEFVGTLDYAAPEQFEGKPMDGRADVYSLGCVLYECLTAEVPYPQGNQAAVVYSHLHAPPPKVTRKRPELPPAVDAVVAKAMAKSPEDRYSSAGDLAEAAADALGLKVVSPSGLTKGLPPARRPPSKRFLVLIGAGVAAVIALVVVALSIGKKGNAPSTLSPTSPSFIAPALTDYVARVDPTTKQIVARIPMGEHPIDIAVGEGSVWVLDKDGSVRRIDPVTNTATVIVGVGEDPRAIAVGEGAVWVADGSHGVKEIDAASNQVVSSFTAGNVSEDIAVGGGAIWVAAHERIVRIDSASGQVKEVVSDLGVFGIGRYLNGFGGGFVWEVDPAGGLFRYDPSSDSVDNFSVHLVPQGLAAGTADVWVTGCGTPGRVVRVDAQTATLTNIAGGASVCTAFSNRTTIGIAVGDEGVWVTDTVYGAVSSIRDVDNEVGQPILVGATPTAIAVGLGSVWVAVDGEASPSPTASS